MTDPAVPPEHWAIVSNLLDEALLLPIEAHPQWLIDLPREHAHLKETLRSFLELHAQLDGEKYLEAGARLSKIELTPVIQASPGDLIGSYRLLEEIGVGGMGSVWLAERADGEIKRRVALKLPRLVWASDLAERMSSERDILAALEHPNIARLYDAGVDQQGRPYLAMEYVEGRRITDYCDGLCMPLRERVELFLQVITAVQYAHAQLILHRDLKPANVLVNERGEVRLLDFGIAKIMVEPATGVDDLGSTLAHPLTPKYASPEQLANQRLTLTSDVYSLGVMLYKLLTGSSPYRTRDDTRISLELAVMDGDIDAPGATLLDDDCIVRRATSRERLRRQLRGDLGAIVLKALRRNPLERYGSVEALGIDLQRWLADLPVTAVPPSRLDRARKFVLRNRWPVSVTAGAFLIVILAAAVAIWQAQQARQESLRAQATRDFLISLFDNANPELRGGRAPTVYELLNAGEESIDLFFADQPELKSDLWGSLSQLWARVGFLDRSQASLEKKIWALAMINRKQELAIALLDRGNLAIRRSDVSALEQVVLQLDRLKKENRLSDSIDTSIRILKGWLAFMNADYARSEVEFSAALESGEKAQDYTVQISALSGRIQASIKAKNKTAVRRDLQRVYELLPRSRLSTEDALNHEAEILSAVFMLGDYASAWPLALSVIEKSEAIYGAFHESRLPLYAYWGAIAIEIGEEERFLNWLSGYRRANQLSETAESVDELHAQWQRLEVSALIRAGRHDEAREKIGALQRSISPNDAGLSVELRMLTLQLEISDLSEKRASACGNKCEIVTDDIELVSSEALAVASWYAGIQRRSVKDFDQALDLLKASEDWFRDSYGDSHPRTVKISIAIAQTKAIKSVLDGAISAEIMTPIVERLSLLKGNYPNSSKSYIWLESLENEAVLFQRGQSKKSSAYLVMTAVVI